MTPAGDDRRPVLITGGAGFIGSNLADRLAGEGHDVLIFDSLARLGVRDNLDRLVARHAGRVSAIIDDLRDSPSLTAAVHSAKAVFHLAAQVAVTTSIEDPCADFEINLASTVRLLEAARQCDTPPPLIFASTNKVYGALEAIALTCTDAGYRPDDETLAARGVGEDQPLAFHTPYGCSKGAADQYVLDFARTYGLPAAVFRMSCVYGPRQMGTEDQGWVAHFLIRALQGRTITLYGDGHQVRDVLYVDDAVEAYLAAWANIEKVRGRAFNLGGGPANAVSLRQVLKQIEKLTGADLDVCFAPWRMGDQRWFVTDTRAADSMLRLPPRTAWREGMLRLRNWLEGNPAVTVVTNPDGMAMLRAETI